MFQPHVHIPLPAWFWLRWSRPSWLSSPERLLRRLPPRVCHLGRGRISLWVWSSWLVCRDLPWSYDWFDYSSRQKRSVFGEKELVVDICETRDIHSSLRLLQPFSFSSLAAPGGRVKHDQWLVAITMNAGCPVARLFRLHQIPAYTFPYLSIIEFVFYSFPDAAFVPEPGSRPISFPPLSVAFYVSCTSYTIPWRIMLILVWMTCFGIDGWAMTLKLLLLDWSLLQAPHTSLCFLPSE